MWCPILKPSLGFVFSFSSCFSGSKAASTFLLFHSIFHCKEIEFNKSLFLLSVQNVSWPTVWPAVVPSRPASAASARSWWKCNTWSSSQRRSPASSPSRSSNSTSGSVATIQDRIWGEIQWVAKPSCSVSPCRSSPWTTSVSSLETWAAQTVRASAIPASRPRCRPRPCPLRAPSGAAPWRIWWPDSTRWEVAKLPDCWRYRCRQPTVWLNTCTIYEVNRSHLQFTLLT